MCNDYRLWWLQEMALQVVVDSKVTYAVVGIIDLM